MILELKAIVQLAPIHAVQAHNYLTATGLRLVILLNFGAASLERKRVVRNAADSDN
ncbi:MAG: GxxExxY protein [Chloroflexi bacterium]|nr:GxxExxY protein [Chloroflexota bacterium]